MTNFIFIAVLFAAVCHAGWNALIKVGIDPLSTTTLISLGSAIIAVAALPFIGMPAPAAWIWIVASTIVHLFYFAALVESYRTGDFGQVYPIARGSAPLMTAVASLVFVGEQLGVLSWIGITVLAAGVVVGAGGEYAFAPHWSVKAEYLYMDFGTHTYLSPLVAATAPAVVGPGYSWTTSVRERFHIARVGINYKF